MTEPLDTLIYWINERESIRRKKDAGLPRPWTTDPILNEWRFCNVDRNEDRETKWIFENIITKHDKSPVLWFNLVIARMINWSPALKKIGYFDLWYPLQFIGEIERMQQAEEKVYTGAYMIPAGPSGVSKHRWLANDLFTPLWTDMHQFEWAQSCADWAECLRKYDGLGPFLANQIITDMKYSHHLKDAADWDTFVLAGPGTMRGLNRLTGNPLDMQWKQEDANSSLRFLRTTLARIPSLDWAHEVFMDLNNLSNCMCEFDKFLRVKNGEGKPRARYQERKEKSP